MELVFSDAKNGEATCAVGGKHLHSAYNPSREAEQWVARLSAPFNPAAVLVIAPALSYCAPFLRKRFAGATLCAIRMQKDFSAHDGAWDGIFTADETLSDQLFNRLGEEIICSALFFAWQPSEQVFPTETKAVWHAIKACVVKSRDVLATRSFFAKRWIKNSVRFCARVQHTAVLHTGTSDIVIAASGPSLQTSLPHIAQHRAQFFLVAVSSALFPLLHAGITPDLVLSTDGGFWAKKHLLHAGYDVSSVPFALAAEGACPAALFETQTIVPLYYADGIETQFFSACTMTAMSAARNGTVSGTAADFAIALTSGNVYACGLDLAEAQGFQHTQPNALEMQNATNDSRLRPAETRIVASAVASRGALTVYRDWFAAASKRLEKRFFRLSDSYAFAHKLGTIHDVDWDFFAAHVTQAGKKPQFAKTTTVSTQKRRAALAKTAQELFLSADYDAELCPIETLMQKRAASEQERAAYAEAIAQKKTAFVQEVAALL